MPPKKIWTQQEEQYLRDNWYSASIPDMCSHIGVTHPTIRAKVYELGMGPKQLPRVEYHNNRAVIAQRVCIKCGLSGKAFMGNSANPDRYSHYCTDCRAKYDLKELLLLGDKVCNVCKEIKPRVCFGLRMCKSELTIRGECKDCIPKITKQKYSDDPEKFRKRAHDAFMKMTPEQRDAYNAKTREYRKSKPNHKEYMRKYIEENQERISAMHKIRAKIHQERIVTNLEDTYIVGRLVQDTGIKREDLMAIEGIEEIIETKRIQIKIKRATK